MSVAVVVRCHRCNIQATYLAGGAPEACETCGGRLERREDAVVIERAARP